MAVSSPKEEVLGEETSNLLLYSLHILFNQMSNLMKRTPFAIILMTVFIALIGFGIVIPLVPVYAERYGASGTEVGILITVYSLMQFLFAPVAGRLSDRIGRRPVLIGALILTAVSYVLFGLAKSLPMLYMSRILAGIGGADITVAQAYVADVTPKNKRARGMGLFGAAFGVGFTLGPAIAALTVDIADWMPSFIAAGLAAITAVFAFFLLPEPEKKTERQKKTLKTRELGNRLKSVIGLNFIVVFVQSILQSMVVLFNVHHFNWTEKENGYFLASVGVLSAVIQGGFIGKLAKRFGEANLIKVGLMFSAVGLYIIGLVGPLKYLILGSVINVFGFAVTLPALSSIVSKRAPEDRQGEVLGSFQSFGSLARIAAPITGGLVYDLLSPNAPFFTGCGAALVATLVAVVVLRNK